ncbi:MAG: hypothetical protein IJ386_02670 [Clostridia bacterium]|nr:hypothetical protein [Clostridia bacterium]
MKKRIRMTAVMAAIAVAGAVTVYAAYDSSKDPIVSLSYLSDVFKPQVKAELEAELQSSADGIKDQLKAEMDSAISSAVESAKEELKGELSSKIESDYAATFDAIQDQLDVLSNSYEVLTLETNKRLTAQAACEFVLLSGSATVRSAASDSGIIDCTDGVILYDGQTIPLNHKLLVPDNGDGRGFVVTGKAQVLVQGGYTVG